MPGSINSIASVKIICRPCSLCQELKRRLEKAVSMIEREHRIKLCYKYHHDTTMKGIERLSVNAASMPIMVINGKAEFASGSRLPTDKVIKQKLTEIIRFGHLY